MRRVRGACGARQPPPAELQAWLSLDGEALCVTPAFRAQCPDAAEWLALGKRGQESLPKNSKAFVFLGAILQDASESERAAFLQLLPAPIRLAWRLFGGRVYERAMARLDDK